jgi:AcrR family transcriptional regulator
VLKKDFQTVSAKVIIFLFHKKAVLLTALSNIIVKQNRQHMNSVEKLDTEQKIFIAAQTIFLEKGLADTTMQDIANEAGISRTSLHYYYRNKEKLFDTILGNTLDMIFPKINETIQKDIPLVDKIIEISHNYLDVLSNNEQLPGFMVLEMRRDSSKVIEFIVRKSLTIDLYPLEIQMQKEIAEGKIRAVDWYQLGITIMSLCAFPYIAKPVLTSFLGIENKTNFDEFIVKRKESIAEIIRRWMVI